MTMHGERNYWVLWGAIAIVSSTEARAQEVVGPTSNPAGDATTTYIPGPTTTTTTVTQNAPPVTGTLATARGDFELRGDGSGSSTAKGQKDGQYILEGIGSIPSAHTVRRGDTLWSISGQFYRNPYQWPKLWAQNPQILNPHWIYPGDRLRIRSSEASAGVRGRSVPEKTIFLRNYGWVDDPDKEDFGEIVGAPDDQMMLSDGDDAYIEIAEDKEKNIKVELGTEFQIWREVRTLKGREADASGELVEVLGTVRIDRYNPKTRMARAHIIESLDVIERGVKIGPIARQFTITSPTRNQQYLEARILTALYPHQLFGQHQVVFLDRGSKQGVRPGNRFIAVRRGDRWVESLETAGPGATVRAMTEDDRDAEVGDLRIDGPSDRYPNETFGEVRVIDVRDNTCMAVVLESTFEIERDSILVMKKGG